MEIKKIDQDDISDVINLLKELYIELGEERESVEFLNEALINQLLSNGKTMIYKAVNSQNRTIGIISITESQSIYSGGDYGSIDEMYIEPEYRNQQIGQLLVNQAKRIAAYRKWTRIEVTAPTDNNERAINFYEKNGFVFTGPKMKFILGN